MTTAAGVAGTPVLAGLHPLLQRQLKRVGITVDAATAGHPHLLQLLERISRAYADAEQDRYLMERSQELASREMGVLHAELKASQGRLASLVSLSSDWVWEQDADLRFRYVSAHGQGATSELAQLLEGRCLAAITAACHAGIAGHAGNPGAAGAGAAAGAACSGDLPAYELCVAQRQPFRNLTFRVLRPDGQPCHIRISGEPVHEGDAFAGYRGVGSDVTQATLAEQKVLQLARYDSLTGLPNRSMFLAQLEQALVRSQNSGAGLALFFIDLDRFKAINDSLGHDAGDELLKVMGKRLSGLLRGADTVARLGGDEFVVVLADCVDPAALSKVASRMLTTLCEPLRLADRQVQISASVGISLFPADAGDAPTLIKSADAAMYLAKSRGKNNFQFFTPQLAERAARHFALEGDLRQALVRGEFRLHYQPRYAVASRAVCGMEALIRWQHPQRGLIAPGDFIELAEESGLIVPIGRWVLDEACRQIRAWREQGLNPPPCAINLSARQFGSDAVVDEVRAALDAMVLEPAALEVEITESLLMADAQRAQTVLMRLHALGVSIAIDDFGTGYSSLAYLKRFPAQTLKIDRSFVRGLPDDRDDGAITQAVIALAHSLGMRVVAEGVETEAQFRYLHAHHCDEVQGFLLARPLPPEQLAGLLVAARGNPECAAARAAPGACPARAEAPRLPSAQPRATTMEGSVQP